MLSDQLEIRDKKGMDIRGIDFVFEEIMRATDFMRERISVQGRIDYS